MSIDIEKIKKIEEKLSELVENLNEETDIKKVKLIKEKMTTLKIAKETLINHIKI